MCASSIREGVTRCRCHLDQSPALFWRWRSRPLRPVERLTLFDFGGLPAARPRVRQFLIPDLDCASLSRVLINGAETCTGENLPQDACTRDLDLRSRTDMELVG